MDSKIHTRFQTWPLRNYVNITLIRTPPPPQKKNKKQKKISENPFRIRTFLFLSYSFGIETINTFTHSCGSLDNNTRFQDEKEQKSSPLGGGGGAHTYSYVAYARGYPWGFSLAWATQQGQVAKRCQNANESLLCCFRKDRL